MNIAAAASISSTAIALCVGILSRRISDAPGAHDQRRFSLIAFSSAAYGLCNLAINVGASRQLVLAASGAQVATALAQVWGWIWYSQAFVQRRPGSAERLASAALLAGAAAALVPGVVLDGQVVLRPFPALGTVYQQASTTPFGTLLLGLVLVGTFPILARFARAWRAGVPHAGVLAVAFAALILLGANDALVIARFLDTPYLLDIGFAAPVLAVGWVSTDRFVQSSQALERLQGRLFAEVEARTKDLASALGALGQAEKLAAVGQFANGVAHEVNSPAAVVMTNLRYLEEASRGGELPSDAGDALRDALAAMNRINDLVRKLVDAGRTTSTSDAPEPAAIGDVARKAAENARHRLPAQIVLTVDVPGDLFARTRRDSLEQVLANLIANASEAIPAGRAGRIAVRAEAADGVARITVTDDGAGMGPEVLRRALDPFFTTKPPGQGVGLGLAVARGLVEADGGALRLESTPGAGTTAIVDLPEAAEPPLAPALTPVPVRPPPRADTPSPGP